MDIQQVCKAAYEAVTRYKYVEDIPLPALWVAGESLSKKLTGWMIRYGEWPKHWQDYAITYYGLAGPEGAPDTGGEPVRELGVFWCSLASYAINQEIQQNKVRLSEVPQP